MLIALPLSRACANTPFLILSLRDCTLDLVLLATLCRIDTCAWDETTITRSQYCGPLYETCLAPILWRFWQSHRGGRWSWIVLWCLRLWLGFDLVQHSLPHENTVCSPVSFQTAAITLADGYLHGRTRAVALEKLYRPQAACVHLLTLFVVRFVTARGE